MGQVLAAAAQMAAGIALPALFIKWDQRRLTRALLDRCWPASSFWCAVVAFGLLSVPVHFCRTRRSVLGLVQGLLWTLALAIVVALMGWMSGPISK
jgi:hypothetical protein